MLPLPIVHIGTSITVIQNTYPGFGWFTVYSSLLKQKEVKIEILCKGNKTFGAHCTFAPFHWFTNIRGTKTSGAYCTFAPFHWFTNIRGTKTFGAHCTFAPCLCLTNIRGNKTFGAHCTFAPPFLCLLLLHKIHDGTVDKDWYDVVSICVVCITLRFFELREGSYCMCSKLKYCCRAPRVFGDGKYST